MYEMSIKILEENLTHFKRNRAIEIEGYNKRGDKMGALGCAMAYEQVFADISDALETLKSISADMNEENGEDMSIETLESISEEMSKDVREGEDMSIETLESISEEMSKDVREGEEIDRRDGASGD